MSDPIPRQIALKLCEKIRTKNQQKIWPFGIGKMQCYFCWRFGKKEFNTGNPEKLCAFASDDNRGCIQVNKLYKSRYLENVKK